MLNHHITSSFNNLEMTQVCLFTTLVKRMQPL